MIAIYLTWWTLMFESEAGRADALRRLIARRDLTAHLLFLARQGWRPNSLHPSPGHRGL